MTPGQHETEYFGREGMRIPSPLLALTVLFSACWINKSNGQSGLQSSPPPLQTRINFSFPGTFGGAVAIKCFAGPQAEKYQECYEDEAYRTCFTKRIDGEQKIFLIIICI